MKNREWRTAMLQLSLENRRTLRRMARYLDSYALNEVAYEELMSDLAGMALECQERQQPFCEAVGMDEVAFCHELVANCPRETRAERILGGCSWIVLWIGLVLPVMMLLEVIFTWMPGSCEGLLYHTPLSFLLKYCTTAALAACGLFFLKRMSYYSKSLIGTVYLIVFLVVFITVSEVCTYLLGAMQVSISLVVWAVVFGILLLLCYVAKRCTAMTVAYQQKKRQLKEQKQ